MDPPDVLASDLTSTRPTQLPGRSKSERRIWKFKPAAWVSASKQGLKSPNHQFEVSLIDFGEEYAPPAPSPSPVVEVHIPTLARLALEADNILDRTPPQSPSRSLPRPLHPTPVVDWDARPLPPPPAYDDVAQDEDDMEVSSINSTEHREEQPLTSGHTTEEESGGPCSLNKPGLEDNLFLPTKQSCSSAFSQSAEIFQELQQECMRRLHVPLTPLTPLCNEDKPLIPPRVPIPPRPIKRGDYSGSRWSQDLSLSPSPADLTEEQSAPDQERPPQIPPRDPLSGSRTPSPLSLVVGSPQPRVYSISPTTMPTTHSFASDPKYAAPKVIQAQGKESANKGPCILPIVRDGRKVSNTHYYLLPERPPYLDRYDRFFRETESFPSSPVEDRAGRHPNMAAVKPMVVNSQTLPGHCPGQEGAPSADLIRMVQEAVHGVTIEECQAALHNHSWSVQKAVHYLKVEQLFCLGLRSRAECLKLLEMCDWNLEVASTQMLDNYGSTTRQRYNI
uniref:UBA domain-containing protein n=1 Tax=Periophthalmus magnuspinnatus TaxID=409849 RepID=A0A3B4B6G6_9GOBI